MELGYNSIFLIAKDDFPKDWLILLGIHQPDNILQKYSLI